MNDPVSTITDAEKLKALDALLTEEYVMVHVNTSIQGLSIPTYLTKQGTVTLRLSRLFRRPVELTREKVTAELLFKGDYFSCEIPWKAIWGITTPNGEGKMWPSDIPADVVDSILTPGKAESRAGAVSIKSEKKIRSATQIDSVDSSDDAIKNDSTLKKKSTASRGHLRRVK